MNVSADVSVCIQLSQQTQLQQNFLICSFQDRCSWRCVSRQ